MSEKSPQNPGNKPNPFYYSVIGLGIVVTLSRLIFGLKIRRDKAVVKMPGPLVCVGNHPSFIDPIIMATVLYGRRINFVAGAFMFRNHFIGPLFKKGGCIPKVQFRSDSRAVKGMLTVLKRGGTLGIFPEATRLVDGESFPFDDAIARMIKKTESSVAVMVSHGAYMTWPRWSKSGFRRGKITANIKSVLSADKVREMSIEEIHKYVLKELEYSEYDWFEKHPQKFRNRALAAGAQNVAHACPRCEKDMVMRSEKDLLICGSCGNRVRVEKTGFFSPVTPGDKAFSDMHKWVEWERERMKARVAEPGFTLTEKVTLFKQFGEYAFREVGKGILVIRDAKAEYTGTECPVEEGVEYKKGKPRSKNLIPEENRHYAQVSKIFPVDRLRGLKIEYGKRIELIEAGGEINRFIPENGQITFEMQTAIEAMQEQIENKR